MKKLKTLPPSIVNGKLADVRFRLFVLANLNSVLKFNMRRHELRQNLCLVPLRARLGFKGAQRQMRDRFELRQQSAILMEATQGLGREAQSLMQMLPPPPAPAEPAPKEDA